MFKGSLGYIMSSRPLWTAELDSTSDKICSKQKATRISLWLSSMIMQRVGLDSSRISMPGRKVLSFLWLWGMKPKALCVRAEQRLSLLRCSPNLFLLSSQEKARI